uniref:Ig-like domain-containing protein n=1 Tax=Ditylenchus dipsaci TaxID=166011 RepID=A0A915DFM6_9BILA
MSLFLSIIEPEDEGIYECIVRNGDVERIHQTSFKVIQSTNETILDLKVSVDHANSCFHTNFRLPASCSALPTNKKHIRCALSVCSNNYNFEPATEYVFRASMVLNQVDMDVITPLSKPASALSFDGYASKGLDLDILYSKYYLEMLNLSTSDSLFPGKKISVNLAEKDLRYTIEKLSTKRPFNYKFRLIPITRAGRPPNNVLDSVDRFAHTFYNTDFANSEVVNLLPAGKDAKAVDLARKAIAAPVVSLKQQDRRPVILVEWSTSMEPWDKAVELIHIRYGNNLAINQHKHVSVQHNFLDGNASLTTDNLELGLVYQVCASVQTTENLTGFWHCSNIPLLDVNGKLLFYREQDFTEDKKLPKPVICERNNCYCQVLPQTQTIRVFWDINSTNNKQEENAVKPSKSKSQPVPSSPAFFVIHYTQNESNPTAPDYSLDFPSTVKLGMRTSRGNGQMCQRAL